MPKSQIVQFDCFAAECDVEAVSKSDVWNRSRPILTNDVVLGLSL